MPDRLQALDPGTHALSASRPFRFGVSIRSAASAAEWREKARRAEALGFSTLLVADHLADQFAPMVALAAAATATTTLRLGTFVLNNDFRHPVLVARETAAIDVLSDGRFELGLGAGHMAFEYRESGIRFERARTRVDRLGEAVSIVKGLLEGEAVTFEGAHYQVAAHRIAPRPVQRPRPPVLVGGNGSRLLSLAAREADIVGLTGFSHRRGGTELDASAFSAAGTDERVAHVRQAAGERFAQLELNALLQRVASGPGAEDGLRDLVKHLGLTAEDAGTSPYLLFGSTEAMVEALTARRERFGISYWAVFEHSMEAAAPVVARLAGG